MGTENNKQRKSEAQEIYEQADNAGRFAGEDADSGSAREQAVENIRQDTDARPQERDKGHNEAAAEGRTDRNQTHDTAGDAQNVEEDGSGRLEGQDAEKARNKASEGLKQGRQDD